MPPTYRQRLRLEGLTLAAWGILASGLLLARRLEARRRRWRTAAQLATVAGVLLYAGPRSVRASLEDSLQVGAGDLGSGEPAPLWRGPLVAGGVGVAARLRGDWRAALIVTGACAIAGLAQAVAFERVVAASERATGRTYVRLKGARLPPGSRLGYVLPLA